MVFAKEYASFLRRNRGAAAVYLREVEHHFPKDARVPLREAAERYDEVSDAMEDLIGLNADVALGFEDGAKIISQALEHERAALANLQSVLDTK